MSATTTAVRTGSNSLGWSIKAYLIPEEEREQKDADVGAVDIGIRHHHDTVVPEAGHVELVTLGGPGGQASSSSNETNKSRDAPRRTAA